MEVAMPVSPMEAPPIASCKAFLPAQTLVPSPWLEAPMERPMAMLFLIFKASKILWLKVAPSMPVKITGGRKRRNTADSGRNIHGNRRCYGFGNH